MINKYKEITTDKRNIMRCVTWKMVPPILVKLEQDMRYESIKFGDVRKNKYEKIRTDKRNMRHRRKCPQYFLHAREM